MRYRLLLITVVVVGLTRPASAGIIFGKKPKPVPEKRVPELIAILKTDGDENKRVEAAEELRQYDPIQFKEIVPTLIEALMTDKKAAVRTEAAQSLGKVHPAMKEVGLALEQARDKDPSMRVRMQARSSLLNQHWIGVRLLPGELKQDKPATKEPPLAPSPTADSVKPSAPVKEVSTPKPVVGPTATPASRTNQRPAPLPPLIDTPPPPSTVPPIINTTNPGNYQPLPKGGPPTNAPNEEKGPDLGPPVK